MDMLEDRLQMVQGKLSNLKLVQEVPRYRGFRPESSNYTLRMLCIWLPSNLGQKASKIHEIPTHLIGTGDLLPSDCHVTLRRNLHRIL